MFVIKMMLIALMLTLIIEIIISIILGVRQKMDILNIGLVNIMTNPVVTSVSFYVNLRYGIFYKNIVLALLEVLAIIIEGYCYKKYFNYKKINPFLLSIILNVCSFTIGLFINHFIY